MDGKFKNLELQQESWPFFLKRLQKMFPFIAYI
jgi:hypothetical protein